MTAPSTTQTALTRRIIPCLDVTGGRVVKGIEFVDLRDAGDPVELAGFYDREGADELVFLDITATSDSRGTIIDVIERTADQIFIPLTVGGGIRSVDDIKQLLRAGADKVSINSAALANPSLISAGADVFGSQCIVVAIDTRRDPETGKWVVYSHGGRKPVDRDAISWAVEAARLGAGELLVTSMDRDGTRDGYDLDLLEAIGSTVGIPLIASGGAGALEHLAEGLAPGRADAVLAASIFHFGDVRIHEAKTYLAQRGIPVRL